MIERHNDSCTKFANVFLAICQDLKVHAMPSATWLYLLDKEQPCNNCKVHYIKSQNPSGQLSASTVNTWHDNEVQVFQCRQSSVIDMFEE